MLMLPPPPRPTKYPVLKIPVQIMILDNETIIKA